MNTPNPLMPQGSLEAQATNKRSMIKIVVSTILAVHGVVLGGLLFLGCKEEGPDSKTPEFADSGIALQEPIDDSDDPFGSLGLPDTADPIDIPGTDPLGGGNTNAGLPPLPPLGNTGGFSVEPNTPGLPGTTTNVEVPDTLPNTRFQPTEPAPTTLVPQALTTYAVLPGDNFTVIARKHGLKPSDIARANPGVDSRRLQVGQELNLPPNVPAVTPDIPKPGAETQPGGIEYTVVSGDTLFGLANKYGVKVKEIQDANNIRGSTIRVGQKLYIPLPNN